MLETLRVLADLVTAYKERSRQLREDAVADRKLTARIAAVEMASKRLASMEQDATPANIVLILGPIEHLIRTGKVLGDN